MLNTDRQSWIYFLAGYSVVLRHRWGLSCVIPCRRFMLLLINIYVKFERCMSSSGNEIALSKLSTLTTLYLVQRFTFDLKSLCLEHLYQNLLEGPLCLTL